MYKNIKIVQNVNVRVTGYGGRRGGGTKESAREMKGEIGRGANVGAAMKDAGGISEHGKFETY